MHISKSFLTRQNVLKLTYSNLKFKVFILGVDPRVRGWVREGEEEVFGKGEARSYREGKEGHGKLGREILPLTKFTST